MDIVKETICQLKNTLLELTDNSIKKGDGNKKCSARFFDEFRRTIETVEDVLLDEDNFVDFITFSSLVELHVGIDTASELNMFLKTYKV